MAKIAKKKPAAKPAAKPVAKQAVKPAAKAASAKKTTPKPAAKKAPAKVAVKKKAEKPAPKVAAKKPEIKKKPVAKVAAAKPAKKEAVKPAVKANAKKPEKIEKVEKPEAKKATPAPTPVVEKSPKKDAKANKKAPAKGKKPEKEENDLDDNFIADDDDLMGDEIGEYEEELKAVEEADEEVEVVEEWTGDEKAPVDEEIYLTDAEGRRYCRARDCDQISIVDAYCRYHYLLFWKRIQVRKKILADGKLERYVEELTSRYPDKFLEMIRRDLRTEKDFLGAIQELEIDESATENDLEDDTNAYIEEVRGMEGSSSSGVEDDEY